MKVKIVGKWKEFRGLVAAIGAVPMPRVQTNVWVGKSIVHKIIVSLN